MKGFDYHYKVYGKTNSNDLYIARDPAAAGVPGVAGFYLTRNTNKDEPQFYNLEHPVSRASAAKAGFTREASYDLELHDINEDGTQDLIITGLEDKTLGRWDVIVYSSTTTNGSPIGYKEMDRDFQNFFAELGKWIQDNDYFHDNAGILAKVPKITGYSFATNPRNGLLYFGARPMSVGLRPAICASPLVYCVDVLADSDFANDPDILYSLTPYAAFVKDEEDDPSLANGWMLVAVYFSQTATFDILDYSSFTPAYALSPALKSVIDTGKLVAGSAAERLISSVLATVFGGIDVLPSTTVIGRTMDEQARSLASRMWWILAKWAPPNVDVIDDVRGNDKLDELMVKELKLLQAQGKLAAGNNEWGFAIDLINGELTTVGLEEGSTDYSATIDLTLATKAIGHSHPASNVMNNKSLDPNTYPEYLRAYIRDLENICRELPGREDHIPVTDNKVPNYIITPSGAVRVVELKIIKSLLEQYQVMISWAKQFIPQVILKRKKLDTLALEKSLFPDNMILFLDQTLHAIVVQYQFLNK